jgi:hypothetical protein
MGKSNLKTPHGKKGKVQNQIEKERRNCYRRKTKENHIT